MNALHFLSLCHQVGCLNPASALSTPYCHEHSPVYVPPTHRCKWCGKPAVHTFCHAACELAYEAFFITEEVYE